MAAQPRRVNRHVTISRCLGEGQGLQEKQTKVVAFQDILWSRTRWTWVCLGGLNQRADHIRVFYRLRLISSTGLHAVLIKGIGLYSLTRHAEYLQPLGSTASCYQIVSSMHVRQINSLAKPKKKRNGRKRKTATVWKHMVDFWLVMYSIVTRSLVRLDQATVDLQEETSTPPCPRPSIFRWTCPDS